jgi:phage-related protein
MLAMMKGSKPLVWLHGEVKTPPFSQAARIETGFLLRRLQNGDAIEMPASRPMPSIAPRCHELRIDDGAVSWRVVYYVDTDAIVILSVFQKKSRTTPQQVIEVARKRLRAFQQATREE